MAHYAQIDSNNTVIQVIVIPDEYENNGQEYINNVLNIEGTWLKTSYNTKANKHANGGTPYRGNYAGIGFTYDENLDVFIESKPYPSWVLNMETFTWEPPVALPELDITTSTIPSSGYSWNEATLSWDKVTTK